MPKGESNEKREDLELPENKEVESLDLGLAFLQKKLEDLKKIKGI